MELNETINLIVKGHVLITDITDPNNESVVLDKSNAIHPENFSIAVAFALANGGRNRQSEGDLGLIKFMAFGSGGSTVNSGSGKITYLRPNISSSTSSLYHQTYQKLVDSNDPLMDEADRDTNNIEVNHITGNLFTDLIITCTLDASEPSFQPLLDNSSETDQDFVFDELGLIDSAGNLITHLIFHPIQKSTNRILQIKYSLRIQVV